MVFAGKTTTAPPSFPRRRESSLVGTETYQKKRFLQPCVLDSRFRGNDELEVTQNSKKPKPDGLDSHFRGNDGILDCGYLSGMAVWKLPKETGQAGFPLS
ncbi:hypothetical protein NEILACOT_05435 [Neisseria lactamica ATCC 23970]|uniref:Uncharacterized protein n=1 Tax=Neisseria lactamica ATCC 23970 TaxID=546265 RepID=D0WCZ9_NEILA|nr:hypothetical protein NEILACOT_05435 [Neisseria lactamica ATCC 23970]